MDIIQLLITVAGFIGLGTYQHYKIRTLRTQKTALSELLEKMKIYFDLYDPEKLKYLLELTEKAIEEKKNIEVEKIRQKLSQEMETKLKKSSHAFADLLKAFHNIYFTLGTAIASVPHDKRLEIINRIEDNDQRKIWQEMLPFLEELDQKRAQNLMDMLASGNYSIVSSGKAGIRIQKKV